MTRRMICLMLAALLGLAACGTRAESAPGSRLGFELLEYLADGRENQFVSPVSLAFALSMASAGARGETEEALLTALDAENARDVASLGGALSDSGLRAANAAFVRDGLALRDGYLDAMDALFDAQALPLDDAARVNAWVKERTDGLIDRLLDGAPAPDVMLLLVNAIAMQAKWEQPFRDFMTCMDAFCAPDGEKRTLFMHRTFDAPYGERDGAQYIRLDYADSDLYALVILPEDGGMDGVLSALAAEGLDGFALPEAESSVALSLPKLDVSASNDLREPLCAMGLGVIFDAEADFSGMSDERLSVSGVIQKVRVQVDEEGTRAAAATGVAAALGALEDDRQVIEMNVNRPFVFIIADEPTGAVCFAGVVADPTAR